MYFFNDDDIFNEADKYLHIAQKLDRDKSIPYYKTAQKYYNIIYEKGTNNRLISGSCINLCNIEMLLHIEKNLSRNLDVCISESTYIKCMNFLKESEKFNKDNPNIIGYKITLYICRGMYEEATQLLEELKSINLNPIYNYLYNIEILMGKLHIEFKYNFINKERINFYENLYYKLSRLNVNNTKEKEMLDKFISIVIESLVIMHKLICNENPKKIVDFYKGVYSKYPNLAPEISDIISSCCMSIDEREYYVFLESLMENILDNPLFVNNSTRPMNIVHYKTRLHIAYGKLGKYKECREIDEYNLKIVRNNTNLHNAGHTMLKLKEYDMAIKYLKQALFIYEDETSYRVLADCYFESNKFEEAKEYYIKALSFMNRNSLAFIKKDGENYTRSTYVGNIYKEKINLYQSIINSYINLKEYSTALAYNSIAENEFSNEDIFRMNNKLIENFIKLNNEQNMKEFKLNEVNNILNKQQDYVKKALSKVSEWAEEIMDVQIKDDNIDSDEFNELEKVIENILLISENMKFQLSKNNNKYNKLRRELLNKYKGLELKSIDFLATGEFLYITNEGLMIDYAPIMVEFCKVVEVELNEYLKKKTGNECKYTLGQLNKIIHKYNEIDLKEQLFTITKYRNESAHSGLIDRKKVDNIREILYNQELIKMLINMKKIKNNK